MDIKKKVGCDGGHLEPSIWRLREVEWSEVLVGFTAWFYLNLDLRGKKKTKKVVKTKNIAATLQR